ncbi:aminoglycoside phosphotransferase family protein [Streptomyces sp. NPDC053367]|uniref:aminoglycoside phosphotransferase family protein n=1 Tax=Streptomyces sp. NPDC053367 TaxID=3365700 RepID=UPI0037D86368
MYEIDAERVLRRDRAGWGDALAEGAVMEYVRGHGCPVPRVCLADSSRTDPVMRRPAGPTTLRACAAGDLAPGEAGAVLAHLLRALHALPGRRPGTRVLHLGLHPDYVVLTPRRTAGRRLVEHRGRRTRAGLGDVRGDPRPGRGDRPRVGRPGPRDAVRLSALLSGDPGLTGPGLRQAPRRRAANPTLGPAEVAALGEAERLIRSLT